MKIKIQMTLGLLALAAGCATHDEPIVFTDDAAVRAAAASAVAAPQPGKLARADEWRIEQLVFGYLLEQHFGDLTNCSAIFLQADDAQVAALMKKYPAHVPPIKPSSRAAVQAHRAPLDKDTNKPAMILSAEVNEPKPDGSVDALGRWFAGDAVVGFRAFSLKKTDGDWQIVNVK